MLPLLPEEILITSDSGLFDRTLSGFTDSGLWEAAAAEDGVLEATTTGGLPRDDELCGDGGKAGEEKEAADGVREGSGDGGVGGDRWRWL